MAIVPLTKSKTEFFGAFTIRPDLLRLGAFSSAVERRGSGRTVGLSCGTRASLPTRAGETGFLGLACSRWVLSWCSCDRRRPLGNLRMTHDTLCQMVLEQGGAYLLILCPLVCGFQRAAAKVNPSPNPYLSRVDLFFLTRTKLRVNTFEPR